MSKLIGALFAGGGGACEGIRDELGRSPDFAINHDAIAIAMHAANHPDTRHYTEDVWCVDPLEATQGKPVGLLWASPDCKHFSKAKGACLVRSKEIRSLAWVVVKWAQKVRPRVVILENVEEFEQWGPLDGDGKIIDLQRGFTFRSFIWQLRREGYHVEWRCLRACDYGAPTIRRRLFLVARCDGLPIVWPEATHGPGRMPYRTAAEIIDWSIPCPSIFERKKPLAENTLKRIARGIRKYVVEAKEPFIVPIAHYNGSVRTNSISEPLRTITASPKGGSMALVTAFPAKHYGNGVTGQPLFLPLGTVTTVDHHSLVTAHLQRDFGHSIGQTVTEPAPTTTAGGGGKTGLVTSHLIKLRGTCRDGQDVRDPMPTITAGGNHVGEVRAFLIKYYGSQQSPALREPLHTITTRDRFGLATVQIAAGELYMIVDIGMRMLQPHELFRAQGFPDSYQIDLEINGRRISKADQVRMCGNSVCPPVAAAIVGANYQENALKPGKIVQKGK